MKITIAIPYYEAPQMLAEQLRHISEYSEEVRKCVHFIIVDDGSPKYPAVDVIHNESPLIDISIYRIKEDIPWNISGALNLAFTEADEGWVYSSAVDHVIPAKYMERLVERLPTLDFTKYYRLPRYHFPGDVLAEKSEGRSFGNLFLLTREMFWNVGGYDEDFAGWYGGTGPVFRKALNRKAGQVILEDVHIWCYENQHIPDANVTTLKRGGYSRVRYNPKINMRLKKENYNPINPLRFTWEQMI